jgi:hypothetical protein
VFWTLYVLQRLLAGDPTSRCRASVVVTITGKNHATSLVSQPKSGADFLSPAWWWKPCPRALENSPKARKRL